MEIIQEFDVLVIAGFWNKFILSPEWVNKYLIIDEKLEVEFLINNPISSVRISSKNIRICILDNKLVLTARNQENETLNKIEELALKFADYLPHTPVSAFGINYKFTGTINEKIKTCYSNDEIKEFHDIGYNVNKTLLHKSFKKDNHELNFKILNTQDTSCELDFNYHYAVNDLVGFKTLFEPNILIKAKTETIDLLNKTFSD